MLRQGYSHLCSDLETRWDALLRKCVPCVLRPGYEVTPNCGYDDDGGRHERPWKECPTGSFNDGGVASCRPCGGCGPGPPPWRACNATTDTLCLPANSSSTEPVEYVDSGKAGHRLGENSNVFTHHTLLAVSLTVLVLILVLVLFLWIKRTRRGQNAALDFVRRRSHPTTSFSLLSAPAGKLLEDTLDSAVLAAPVQAVLNNLDVLEDLVILLDPEIQGVKNTKHLASHCGFSSPWITYAYSMRNSKSPLKAVLERVTSTHPDCTVGDMAKMLRLMERYDAISVLAKLRPGDKVFRTFSLVDSSSV